MKKLLLYVSVGVFVLGLSACNSQTKDPQTGSQPSVAQPESSASAESSSSESGAQTGGGTGSIGFNEETGKWSDEMQALKDAVVAEMGENYWPNMPVPADFLEGSYGVAPDLYEDYLAEMPLMSAHVDVLVIVKAKEGKAETVEKALTAYRDNVVNNSMQYPMNVGKVQASRVERIGNYVCFVQLGGDVTKEQDKGDEAVIAHCQEQNELAIEIISKNIEQ